MNPFNMIHLVKRETLNNVIYNTDNLRHEDLFLSKPLFRLELKTYLSIKVSLCKGCIECIFL